MLRPRNNIYTISAVLVTLHDDMRRLTINYLDWYNHVPNSFEETQPGCDILNTHGINPAGTDLAAKPMFSLPPGLSSLEPIWSSYGCQPNGLFPGFDPPRVLTKTSALAPGVQHPASQSAVPTPAAKLSPPIVAPTNANNAHPTPEASIPNPKSVNADPKAGGLLPGPAISDPNPTPASQDADPDPLEDDPAAITKGANLPTAGISASGEVAGQPLLNSDPINQGLGFGSSQNIGKDHPNAPIGFTVGKEVVTANSASQYIANGQTITPRAPVVIIYGTSISLSPSANNVVIGINTIPLKQPSPSALPSFTFGNQLITADSASHYIINSHTLTPGAPAITVSGTPISLASSSAYIAIGSTTIPLLDAAITPFTPTIIVNDQIITANSASQFVIGGGG